MRKKFKDDWELQKAVEESFLNHNFWRVPDQYRIDQLLEEIEDPNI